MGKKRSDIPLPLPGERLVSSSHRLEEMRMKYGIPQGMPFILLDVSETGFLSLTQAAAYLSRSPRWLRRLLPEIRHYRPPGGQLLFRKKDLDTFMERYARDPLAEILSREKRPLDLGEITRRMGGRGPVRMVRPRPGNTAHRSSASARSSRRPQDPFLISCRLSARRTQGDLNTRPRVWEPLTRVFP
jgi:excisionase family DNA binding protein